MSVCRFVSACLAANCFLFLFLENLIPVFINPPRVCGLCLIFQNHKFQAVFFLHTESVQCVCLWCQGHTEVNQSENGARITGCLLPPLTQTFPDLRIPPQSFVVAHLRPFPSSSSETSAWQDGAEKVLVTFDTYPSCLPMGGSWVSRSLISWRSLEDIINWLIDPSHPLCYLPVQLLSWIIFKLFFYNDVQTHLFPV